MSHTHVLAGQEARGSGYQCDGSSRLPGAGGGGAAGSVYRSTLCLTGHIRGTIHSVMFERSTNVFMHVYPSMLVEAVVTSF